MSRKKKVEAPPVVPEYIQQTRTYQRKRITKRKVASFEEAILILHIPELARKYLMALMQGLDERDKTALEHTGRILNYVQDKGISINIAQQMLQQQQAAGEAAPVVGFDAFARRLAEARAGHALPAPQEPAIDAEVIDVHPVDRETSHGSV